jgi:predicted amidohydrolase YtcJ
MHTMHRAFASFEEGFNGSLGVAKAADLVAPTGDLGRTPVERLRDVGEVMTVVGGEVVDEA